MKDSEKTREQLISELASLRQQLAEMVRPQADDGRPNSEARYHSLFENTPISLWEEDYSQAKIYIDDLRASGVSDFRQYFDHHPQALVHCASLITILDVNKAAVELYEASHKEDLLGSLDAILVDESYAMFREEMLALIEGNTRFEGESIERRLSGDPIVSSAGIAIIPGYENTWARMLAYVKDVTESKRAQEVQMELALQRERIELLEELVGNISHDIKTPLTTILSLAYLLRQQPEPQKQQKYLDRLEAQANRLNSLIDDVLTISRLDNIVQLELSHFNLNALIETVSRAFLSQMEQKRISLSLDLAPNLPSVTADEIELSHALTAIIENAVSYTPPEQSIRIQTNQRDGDVVVAIQDTGVGISEADLLRIFDRFFRVDQARNTSHGGTGLGLSIAHRILALHHGTIRVQSTLGQGSTFSIHLPVDV